MARRPLQEINAGSMADIAFLLLIFFLVTTTMETNKGLPRKLSEITDEPPPVDFQKRDVFTVLINSNNDLLVRNEPGNLATLCDDVKEFIKNPEDKDHLSRRKSEPKKVEFFGMVNYISRGVVSLQNDRNTKYKKYIEVQNELVRAFAELRDEKAKQKFGLTYKELEAIEKKGDPTAKAKLKAIRTIYPLAISEAEPRKIAK